IHRAPKKRIRLALAQTRLPDILALIILELPDRLQRTVLHEPRRTLAIRPAQSMLQVDQIVPSHRSGRDGDADLSAAHNPERLAAAVAVDHGALLRATERAAEDIRHVLLDREEGVLHQLLADLGDAPELVRADDHLADIDLDRDLPLTRHALADVTDSAHDILVLQLLDELADELIRHSVSAGAVRHEAECTRLGARDRLPGHEVPECGAILARTLAI